MVIGNSKLVIGNSIKAVLILLLMLTGESMLSPKNGALIGRIGSVSRSNKEIIINIESGKTLKMGDEVYVRADGDLLVMEVTFPMQTTSRCKLLKNYSKSIKNIKKGMNVYLYDKSVLEDKGNSENTDTAGSATDKGHLSHSAMIGEWECTIPNNRFRLNIIWNASAGRYEGRLTKIAQESASVGFYVGELVYMAYPTDNAYVLRENAKARSSGCCLLLIPPGETWYSGTVDMSGWVSGEEGIFYVSHTFVRIK